MTRILYLHGFASSPSSTKARYFRERLESAGMHVDVPDLAAGDFEHLTVTAQLAVMERMAAGNPPPAVTGSSLGGYLAALYAARHPEIPRVVLLAPAFGFPRRWADTLDEQQLSEWRRTGTIDVFHYAENRTRKLHYGLLEDAAHYEDYPDFRQPALIFHGAHDNVVPAACSETFAARHPNAKLEVLDAGHDLLNVLDCMAERILPFLR